MSSSICRDCGKVLYLHRTYKLNGVFRFVCRATKTLSSILSRRKGSEDRIAKDGLLLSWIVDFSLKISLLTFKLNSIESWHDVDDGDAFLNCCCRTPGSITLI